MAQFSLEKILYFTEKSNGGGFHVGKKDSSGTDIARIIKDAKTQGFIEKEEKPARIRGGSYVFITKLGEARLLVEQTQSRKKLGKDFSPQVTKLASKLAELDLDKDFSRYIIQAGSKQCLDARTSEKSTIKQLNRLALIEPSMKHQGKNKLTLRKPFVNLPRELILLDPTLTNQAVPKQITTKEIEQEKDVSIKADTVADYADNFLDAPDDALNDAPRDKPPVNQADFDTSKWNLKEKASAIKTANLFFKDETVFPDYIDDPFIEKENEMSVSKLSGAGIIEEVARDDGAVFYSLTDTGTNKLNEFVNEAEKIAGLRNANATAFSKPEPVIAVSMETITLNGISVNVPNKFNDNVDYSEYVKTGRELAEKLLGPSLANTVNDLYWDVAFDETKNLSLAIQELIELGPTLEATQEKNAAYKPEAIREQASDLRRKFGFSLSDDQLEGALFMDTFTKTGYELTPHQIKSALEPLTSDELDNRYRPSR